MIYALVAICLAQLVLLFWVLRSQAAERARLLSAVVAQSPAEFVALEKAATPAPKRAKAEEPRVYPIGI